MESHLLDATDVRILQLLQHDARLTNKEIADKTGKSVTPVYERIRRLEAEGVIEGYKAILNKDKIGRSLIAYTNVQLKEHSKTMLRDFEKAIEVLRKKGQKLSTFSGLSFSLQTIAL